MARGNLLGGRELRRVTVTATGRFIALQENSGTCSASRAPERNLPPVVDAVVLEVSASTVHFERAIDEARRAFVHVHRTPPSTR